MRRVTLRLILPAVAVMSAALLGANKASTKSLSFKDAKVGELPKGWTAAKTGKGEGSVWQVVKDETAPGGPNVLAPVSSKGPTSLFNLCVADDTKLGDLDLAVSLKAVTGKIDQGGGLVWRYRDENNYYIARMNPLEGNFRVYKVVSGKRTQLGTADVHAPAGKWHVIRILHDGDHIQCFLNDRRYLDVKDDTFKEAGKIGLWTKADAVTYFGDLRFERPRDSEELPKTSGVVQDEPVKLGNSPAAEFKSGPQIGEHVRCLNSVWLVNWPYKGSFRGCMTCSISPAAPVAAIFTRTVDERVSELVLALDLQITEWFSRKGPKAFLCGVGGLGHEHLADLKQAAGHVPLLLPARAKAAEEQIEKLKLNHEAAVTVVIYNRRGKVIANYAFKETKELTRYRIKDVVKSLLAASSN